MKNVNWQLSLLWDVAFRTRLHVGAYITIIILSYHWLVMTPMYMSVRLLCVDSLWINTSDCLQLVLHIVSWLDLRLVFWLLYGSSPQTQLCDLLCVWDPLQPLKLQADLPPSSVRMSLSRATSALSMKGAGMLMPSRFVLGKSWKCVKHFPDFFLFDSNIYRVRQQPWHSEF